jgi:hypothetical protein
LIGHGFTPCLVFQLLGYLTYHFLNLQKQCYTTLAKAKINYFINIKYGFLMEKFYFPLIINLSQTDKFLPKNNCDYCIESVVTAN